jgi:WhiB family redox-sensing transcriptional regulator
MTNEWHAQRHVWRDHANCIGRPTRWFFASERWRELNELALAICAGCPVRLECLEDALDFEVGYRVTFGVRGGLLASDRVELVRRRAAEVVVEVGAATASDQFIGLRDVLAAAI